MKKFVMLMMVVAFVSIFSLIATAQESAKPKVHLTTKVMGNLGVSVADVEKAFEDELEGEHLNVKFVNEKGSDVEEVTIILQVDDNDDDNDGIEDGKDNDDDNNGIADNQEMIGYVDLDKQDPELLKELGDTKTGQGINILIEADNNDAKIKHHVIKFHTEADVPAAEGTAMLKVNHFAKGFAASPVRPFLPKWLKTTFKVVSYTARFASCATGSFTTCFGLIAEGYAK